MTCCLDFVFSHVCHTPQVTERGVNHERPPKDKVGAGSDRHRVPEQFLLKCSDVRVGSVDPMDVFPDFTQVTRCDQHTLLPQHT